MMIKSTNACRIFISLAIVVASTLAVVVWKAPAQMKFGDKCEYACGVFCLFAVVVIFLVGCLAPFISEDENDNHNNQSGT
jgi:hypothetical protein